MRRTPVRKNIVKLRDVVRVSIFTGAGALLILTILRYIALREVNLFGGIHKVR